jgi:hypothetical protein
MTTTIRFYVLVKDSSSKEILGFANRQGEVTDKENRELIPSSELVTLCLDLLTVGLIPVVSGYVEIHDLDA